MSLTKLRKRRNTTKSSIAKLSTRIEELVAHPDVETAQRHLERLKTLDEEFKTHHYSVIDVVDDTEALATEQALLDDHGEAISLMTNKLQEIIKSDTAEVTILNGRDLLVKRLSHLERAMNSTHASITAIPAESTDTHLLHQYEEKLSEFKAELKTVHEELLKLGMEETDEAVTKHTTLTETLFTCSHLLRKALAVRDAPGTLEGSKGIKLPRLDVPTFDGNVLNWSTFWEQFRIAVHDRTSVSDTEKLVYLQQALKKGSAKQAIEGLSQSGDHYTEAIECLKERYGRPRVIHRTHVQVIVDMPPLKTGSGKELREFHDKISSTYVL